MVQFYSEIYDAADDRLTRAYETLGFFTPTADLRREVIMNDGKRTHNVAEA